ncbi:hypothetical protein GF343_02575 [Candidatus Woesearchaeota archaeon]|nr:hypothetical protein [Candidatus Woesearchaeota archaeon]
MSLIQTITEYKKADPERQAEIIHELHADKRFAQLCAIYDYSVMQPDGTLDPRPFEKLSEKDPEFKEYWNRFIFFKEATTEEQDKLLRVLASAKKYQEIIDLHEASTALMSSMVDLAQLQLLAMENKEFGKYFWTYQSEDQKRSDLDFLKNHLEVIVEASQAIIDRDIENADSQWQRVYSICKKMHSLTRDMEYPYKERLLEYVKKQTGCSELPEAAQDMINTGVEEFLEAFQGEDGYFEGYADDEMKERIGRNALDDFFDAE